jgi:hypothetical protein
MKTDTSGAIATVEWGHHMSHMGRMFEFFIEDTDMDNAEVKNILIVTGEKSPHLTIEIEALGGQVAVALFEDTATSNNGTEQNVFAINRVSVKTPFAKVFVDPTITSDGTALPVRRILGFAQGSSKINSAIKFGAERIWKPNSKYLIRLTSAADNVAITIASDFYEV